MASYKLLCRVSALLSLLTVGVIIVLLFNLLMIHESIPIPDKLRRSNDKPAGTDLKLSVKTIEEFYKTSHRIPTPTPKRYAEKPQMAMVKFSESKTDIRLQKSMRETNYLKSIAGTKRNHVISKKVTTGAIIPLIIKESKKYTSSQLSKNKIQEQITGNTSISSMHIPEKTISRLSPNLIDKQSKDKQKNTACQIPDLDPFDISILKYIHLSPKPSCDFNATLTYMTLDGRITVNQSVAMETHKGKFKECVYYIFTKSSLNDDFANYSSNFVRFNNFSETVEGDFVRVVCFDIYQNVIYENMHAIIWKSKPEVAQKVSKAKKRRSDIKLNSMENKLSVVILGFDSMSRSNFIRQLNKTYTFLTKELETFVFKGMNKVHDNTFPNLVPMLTGKSVGKSDKYPPDLRRYQWRRDIEEYYDDYPIIWKNFSAKGYITMMAEDRQEMSTFNYMARGFKESPTDYYLRPFYLAMRDSPLTKQSNNKLCFGSTLRHEIIFKYLKDFVSSFHDVPHFTHTFLSGLSHEWLSHISSADDDIYELINHMYTGKYLENTMLIIFGDHGHRFDSIRRTFIGRLEERLPFFSITLPKWFLIKYPKINMALKTNTERLVSFFDIYETMMNVLLFRNETVLNDVKNRGLSLFGEIPSTRTCEDAHIEQHFCACEKQMPTSLNDGITKKGAQHIVTYINTQLKEYQTICTKLSLSKILDASMIVHNSKILKERVIFDASETLAQVVFNDYVIVLETMPSGAIFEATLRYNVKDKTFRVVGDISRINKYGNQSICIEDDARLRKFCYCIMYLKT